MEGFKAARIAEGDLYIQNMELFIKDMLEYGEQNFPQKELEE